ncbi:glycosyltransferase family 4 protein [Nocardioides xinjiangensis]|uniref:glycosyltransferase family 4 protein n=1 Tax=Nocardioides xinjiangensis TaxID=2817376 RepID=UPI001B302C14|nr:glycosyltransferase family 4 protein [Nocardioides sp. SYSU D00778]
MGERIHLAANNPDLGGGEQVLLRHAEALLDLGHAVTVVSADRPTEVLDAAAAAGAEVVAIRADDRRDYLRRLRAWDRAERDGVVWCHGLVPAVATAGHRRRIVHLHQDPRGRGQVAAAAVARRGALVTLVPSTDMARRVPGSRAHANWTADLPLLDRSAVGSRDVGYLGRLSTDKGVDVLADAVGRLSGVGDLVVAGDARYVPEPDVRVVERALSALGSRVVRLGHVAPGELFARATVVAFPSVWAEPFGLVVAEAMAAGVPFVVSDAGALPEVAGPDHPWVARAGDAADLARVVGDALAATPSEVRAVTDRARSRWAEHYSPRAGRLRVQRLLDDLGVG